MKSAGGLKSMGGMKKSAHGGIEYTQRSANRGNGGKSTKPSKASRAKASMFKGPYGGKKPQS